jgi:hypothetical protein
MSIDIRAQASPWMSGVEIGVFSKDGKSYATNIQMATVSPGVANQSICRLSNDSAQMLFNDLWHCGFRPQNYSESIGELKATKFHLEDMRNLAFKFIDKSEKGEASQ